jgi:hypothetical protein
MLFTHRSFRCGRETGQAPSLHRGLICGLRHRPIVRQSTFCEQTVQFGLGFGANLIRKRTGALPMFGS